MTVKAKREFNVALGCILEGENPRETVCLGERIIFSGELMGPCEKCEALDPKERPKKKGIPE